MPLLPRSMADAVRVGKAPPGTPPFCFHSRIQNSHMIPFTFSFYLYFLVFLISHFLLRFQSSYCDLFALRRHWPHIDLACLPSNGHRRSNVAAAETTRAKSGAPVFSPTHSLTRHLNRCLAHRIFPHCLVPQISFLVLLVCLHLPLLLSASPKFASAPPTRTRTPLLLWRPHRPISLRSQTCTRAPNQDEGRAGRRAARADAKRRRMRCASEAC